MNFMLIFNKGKEMEMEIAYQFSQDIGRLGINIFYR